MKDSVRIRSISTRLLCRSADVSAMNYDVKHKSTGQPVHLRRSLCDYTPINNLKQVILMQRSSVSKKYFSCTFSFKICSINQILNK